MGSHNVSIITLISDIIGAQKLGDEKKCTDKIINVPVQGICASAF